ncbi:hypothetical protein QS795_011130 [Providencia zhijiangensis]|uniref:Uncharacterized protein n=1 Tax=Providencia zhijiangensis TaxID=3053982 RepID=A0ABZ0MYB3_9GAMM|nr:hypothetical protein [Providencia sp. D4759]WPA91039.1 hypothetical protein QS795_011130 [Providencia sp. D4759]
MDEVKQQLKNYQYQIRGFVSTEATEEEKAQLAEAEKETQVFIIQLQERYPNYLGLMGGAIAVLDTLLSWEQE